MKFGAVCIWPTRKMIAQAKPESMKKKLPIDLLPYTDAIMFRNAVWDTGRANKL